MKRLLLALTLAVGLSACVPVANVARDILERADGASVAYLVDGVGFDSGEQAARGVILLIVGDELVLVEQPTSGECTLDVDVIDCRLGDVEGRVTVSVTGMDILASATFRRPGASTVYQAFGN